MRRYSNDNVRPLPMSRWMPIIELPFGAVQCSSMSIPRVAPVHDPAIHASESRVGFGAWLVRSDDHEPITASANSHRIIGTGDRR